MNNNTGPQDLALFGGRKTIPTEFKHYNPLGVEEVEAAKNVIESGVLSQYLGVWHEDFFGGPKVREFEREITDHILGGKK
jgi:perosamine synthetase